MLGKVVALVVSPLGTALLLLACALALEWAGRTRGARWLVAAAALWLTLWATPVMSDALRGSLEDRAGPRALADVPAAEVAVVLGGGVRGPAPPRRPDPDLGEASDRLWHAARLYHAGKVKRLLVTGGAPREGEGAEAPAMERFLVDLGVPASAIWREEASINTATNAELTARMLRERGVSTIVLVTSALHMPRARVNFERTGLVVHLAPTDFEVVDRPWSLLRVLPDAEALQGSARAFKEIVGKVVGR